MRIPEAPVRFPLPRPVPHLPRNRQVLRVARDRRAKVPQRPMRIPEVPVRSPLPRPVPHLPRRRRRKKEEEEEEEGLFRADAVNEEG